MPKGVPNPKPEDGQLVAAAIIPQPDAPVAQTRGVNSLTNYQPSVARNDMDQAVQPTGTGSIAGRGTWQDFDESDLPETPADWRPVPVARALSQLVSPEHGSPAPIDVPAPDEKLFPVRLLRNYRPATDRWYPILSDGRVGARPALDDGMTPKVPAGYFVVLPLSEAKQLIKRGIAERADAIE